MLAVSGCALWGCQTENKHNHVGHEHGQHDTVVSDTAQGSPHRVAMANIGSAHVHIEYHSPAVRGCIIWGGLVPYNEVWVTGAHNATFMYFSKDVVIADKTIEKGQYGFFTIPGKEEWTMILNKNWEQHLTEEYSESEDVLRWKVRPDSASHSERLTYRVMPGDGNSGVVMLNWENVQVTIPIRAAE